MGKKKVPQPRDIPRKAIPPLATRQRLLVPERDGTFQVRWSKFDFDGPWCLSRPEGDIIELMRRIKSFETQRPQEIFGTLESSLGLNYDVASIPNRVAVRRLEELGFGDETQISRLRIGGAPRFYGFRRDPAFYAVFWDPLHEIYPSPKKHT